MSEKEEETSSVLNRRRVKTMAGAMAWMLQVAQGYFHTSLSLQDSSVI